MDNMARVQTIGSMDNIKIICTTILSMEHGQYEVYSITNNMEYGVLTDNH